MQLVILRKRMIISSSPMRVYGVLKLVNSYVKSKPIINYQGSTFGFNGGMTGAKDKLAAMERNKRRKANMLVWRQVSTHSRSEESLVKDLNLHEQDGGCKQEPQCSTSSSISNNQQSIASAEAATDIAGSTVVSTTLNENVKSEGLGTSSAAKHSVSIEVGASLIRFIIGKGGFTKGKIEGEMGVKIIIPRSKEEESVIIEGPSVACVTKASEMVQTILDEAVRSNNLDYSHFVSLPLAIHPELVDKLVSFQNSVLGNDDRFLNENSENGSGEDSSDDGVKDREMNKRLDVTVGLKVEEGNHVRVDLTNIPLVSYGPKASTSGSSSGRVSRIDTSIFIKPQTFHLTVLMLKLWNKERVNAASEVLKNIAPKVLEALDNQPVSIRLKGLECMRGSLAKARVLYAAVEETGAEGRLLRACQVIRDGFTEAGLVLEKDSKEQLKLHATLMNARHRKQKRTMNSFDARGVVKRFGDEDWGEYLIREAHLSQRFVYDANGYYRCCAAIPFPERSENV
ncbi:Activating signal cointegrator 1 complex subunit 1 [Linum perenne]